MPTTSESQRKAVKKYNATNTRSFTLCCNVKTDPDIIAFLEPIENKQAYLKALVRAEIARANSDKKIDIGSAQKYQVEYTDPDTGATSPIDTVRAKPGYTAEEYIDACRRNADPDWCEMLNRGTVTLTPID